MSSPLASRSPDLQRLQEEGYDLEIRDANLLVRVPYVTTDRQIALGLLVSELTTAGDRTGAPNTHVVTFVGESEDSLPCDDAGQILEDLINQRGPMPVGDGLVGSCTFSHKPNPTYPDYYEKMSTYADMLVAYAQALEPSATAKTFPPIATDEDESRFRYFDSATSRARIGAAVEKLHLNKVVIVGLGGTGSYVLDVVAKVPVRQIDLYDSDVMITHNAFRSPGAATIEELRSRPYKVDYLQAKYDPIHRGVVAHPEDVDASNIEDLRDADFVFLCIDAGPAKRDLIVMLQAFGVPFVDAGMGIYRVGDSLGGIVRTTTSAPGHDQHVLVDLTFGDAVDGEYDDNIQIADLNMLNAALAVIRFKRYFGFYVDFEHEFASYYTIDGNHLMNEHADDAA